MRDALRDGRRPAGGGACRSGAPAERVAPAKPERPTDTSDEEIADVIARVDWRILHLANEFAAELLTRAGLTEEEARSAVDDASGCQWQGWWEGKGDEAVDAA